MNLKTLKAIYLACGGVGNKNANDLFNIIQEAEREDMSEGFFFASLKRYQDRIMKERAENKRKEEWNDPRKCFIKELKDLVGEENVCNSQVEWQNNKNEVLARLEGLRRRVFGVEEIEITILIDKVKKL